MTNSNSEARHVKPTRLTFQQEGAEIRLLIQKKNNQLLRSQKDLSWNQIEIPSYIIFIFRKSLRRLQYNLKLKKSSIFFLLNTSIIYLLKILILILDVKTKRNYCKGHAHCQLKRQYQRDLNNIICSVISRQFNNYQPQQYSMFKKCLCQLAFMINNFQNQLS